MSDVPCLVAQKYLYLRVTFDAMGGIVHLPPQTKPQRRNPRQAATSATHTKEAVVDQLGGLASNLEDMAGILSQSRAEDAGPSSEAAALLAGAKAYRRAAELVETIELPVRRRRRRNVVVAAAAATSNEAPARKRGRPARQQAVAD